MAGLFWDPVSSTAPDYSDANFMSTSKVTALMRADISKSVMKKVIPEAQFRKYVSKITDFTAGKSSFFIIPKKMTRDDEITWKPRLGEYEPLPSNQVEYDQFDISVDERGAQFPFTQRAVLFSNFDLEAEIREQASNSIIASIEKDLLLNAFVYLDILGIVDNSNPGKPAVVVGKSLARPKTFATHTTAISVSQVSYDTTNHKIEGITVGTLTMADILSFAKALSDNYTPSYNGKGRDYGNYIVIINDQAKNRLMTDEVFFTAVTRFQDREKLYSGYIGSFYGQEFVEDKGKWIDRLICTLNPELNGKAICIFLGKEAIKEAVVMPEMVSDLQKNDFGRFMTYAIRTYRGESPMWFASAEGQGAGGILVGA